MMRRPVVCVVVCIGYVWNTCNDGDRALRISGMLNGGKTTMQERRSRFGAVDDCRLVC